MELHELPAGNDIPRRFLTVVETPMGSRIRYEFNIEIGAFRRVSRVDEDESYPGDYGFMPSTVSMDGEPLDVLVLCRQPSFPGCILDCRPIALLNLTYNDLPDHKILAVPATDESFDAVTDLADLDEELTGRIGRFFSLHPLPDGQRHVFVGWEGAESARDVVFRAWEGFLVY